LHNMTNLSGSMHLFNLGSLNSRSYHQHTGFHSIAGRTHNLSSFAQVTPNKQLSISSMSLVQPFIKMKYSSSGGLLYAAVSNNQVLKYRRHPNGHRLVGGVLTHRAEINDMDISPFDEYLVTASRDRTVGIL